MSTQTHERAVREQTGSDTPPILTRGVKHTPNTRYAPKLAVTADYLQGSANYPDHLPVFPENPDLSQLAAILRGVVPRHAAVGPTGEAIPPVKGYSHGHQLVNGRVYWHVRRREQKIGVVFAGQDMAGLLRAGLPHEQIIAFALDVWNKITRLDVALDIFDSGGQPNDMFQAWRAGLVETGAERVAPYTNAQKTPEGDIAESSTVYFGHPTSDRQIRIYEKGKELGTGEDRLRVEIVTRRQRAMWLAQNIRQHGIAAAGMQAIRDYIRCDSVAWWRDAMQGTPVQMEPLNPKERNREKWLREQVLPVLVDFLNKQADQGDCTLLDEYYSALSIVRRKCLSAKKTQRGNGIGQGQHE